MTTKVSNPPPPPPPRENRKSAPDFDQGKKTFKKDALGHFLESFDKKLRFPCARSLLETGISS